MYDTLSTAPEKDFSFASLWRVPLRGTAVMLLILFGIATEMVMFTLSGKQWFTTPQGAKIIRSWVRLLARAVNLKILHDGVPVTGLMVANHVSWLDIIAINSVSSVHFVAKQEILNWPFIGPLSARAGTLFVNRNSLVGLRQLSDDITTRLRESQCVVLFPEGTTSHGDRVLPFKGALIECARKANVPVQPVTINYRRNNSLDRVAPYVDESLFNHLLQILRQKDTWVEIVFAAPIHNQSLHRKEIAELCHRHVSLRLQAA